MRIEIKRSGGFAGVEEKLASVESSALPRPAADELRAQVARLSAWCTLHPVTAGTDRFHYEMKVVEPGTEPRTLNVFDEGSPDDPGMKAVLSILQLVGARP